MEINYYKSEVGNIGDDLNPFILRYLLGTDVFDRDDNMVLLFIGTILFDGFEGSKNIENYSTKKKILFGAGIRFINAPLTIDSSFEIRFLRGPYSSYALTGATDSFITDPAYLIRDCLPEDVFEEEKQYRFGLMPHFKSLDKVDWPAIANRLGVHYISPSNELSIEETMREINKCEILITEAMHGAILADASRVPWKRIKFFSHLYENPAVAEFKWADWGRSMNINFTSEEIQYPNFIKLLERKFSNFYFDLVRQRSIEKSISKLKRNIETNISDEQIFQKKIAALRSAIEQLKNDYA
jgi:hypothetical protein